MKTWTFPTSNEIAYKRAGGRRRLNRERQTAAFWLSFQVFLLAKQEGLKPLEIAAHLGIAPVTAYRHYWKWFGKRRPMMAKAKAVAQRIAAAEAEYEARFNSRREVQPVKQDKLIEMLARLKDRC
jgi:hypothetical protein